MHVRVLPCADAGSHLSYPLPSTVFAVLVLALAGPVSGATCPPAIAAELPKIVSWYKRGCGGTASVMVTGFSSDPNFHYTGTWEWGSTVCATVTPMKYFWKQALGVDDNVPGSFEGYHKKTCTASTAAADCACADASCSDGKCTTADARTAPANTCVNKTTNHEITPDEVISACTPQGTFSVCPPSIAAELPNIAKWLWGKYSAGDLVDAFLVTEGDTTSGDETYSGHWSCNSVPGGGKIRMLFNTAENLSLKSTDLNSNFIMITNVRIPGDGNQQCDWLSFTANKKSGKFDIAVPISKTAFETLCKPAGTAKNPSSSSGADNNEPTADCTETKCRSPDATGGHECRAYTYTYSHTYTRTRIHAHTQTHQLTNTDTHTHVHMWTTG